MPGCLRFKKITHWLNTALGVIRRRGLLILILTFTEQLCEEGLTFWLNRIVQDSSEVTIKLIGLGFLALINTVLWPLLITLVLLNAIRNQRYSIFEEPLSLYYEKNFESLCIELLRSIGSIMLWSILFIVPGFIRFLQLSLVPYVVVFDKKYWAGEVDALKRSTEIACGKKWQLFFSFLFIALLPTLLASSLWTDNFFESYNFLALGLTTLVNTLSLLIYLTVNYEIFENKIPEEELIFPRTQLIAQEMS